MRKIRYFIIVKATKFVSAPIVWSLGKKDQSPRARLLRAIWRSL